MFVRVRLSQRFLRPPWPLRIAKCIEGAFPLLAKARILEIGAGKGALTLALAPRCRGIVALEIDPMLVAQLRRRTASLKNVEVVQGDARTFDFKRFAIIVGSIPYHLSSQLLFKILDSRFERAYLILQREFAHRLVAKPGDKEWGRLSASTQAIANTRALLRIPAKAFFPRPMVESTLIEIIAKERGERRRLNQELLQLVFQHSKKTLRAALAKSPYANLLNRIPSSLSAKRIRSLTLDELELLSKLCQGLRPKP